MAEYIERGALYEIAYWHGKTPDVGNPYADGVEAVDVKDIDAIPAADVAPVVRCKDCKKRNKKKCPLVMVRFDMKTNGTIKEILEQNYVDEDFWCKDGERKGDGNG